MHTRFMNLAHAALTTVALVTLVACGTADNTLLAPSASSDRVIAVPSYSWQLIDITAGGGHACAMSRGGSTYCWGSNLSGQTGVPSSASCGDGPLDFCVPSPTLVTGVTWTGGTPLPPVKLVSAGGVSTCALDTGGAAWCWGNNFYGQVGNGSGGGYQYVAKPTPVSGGLTFTTLSAGGRGACGISTALLYCWGQIQENLPDPFTPTLSSGLSGWSTVSVGGNHACARYSGSSTYWACWGDNARAEIAPDNVTWPYFEGPLAVPSIAGSQHVVAGPSQYTCADQSDGTVQCVGDNDAGKLGNPRFTQPFTGTPQTVGGSTGLPLHGVATGRTHACALDKSGAAWCWGGDGAGQLGDGRTGVTSLTPVPVAGGIAFFRLAAGDGFTCGISTIYRVYCWGTNFHGQLGSPSTPFAGSATPVALTFP